MKKLPIKEIKIVISTISFMIIASLVVFIGYCVVPNYDEILWTTRNPEKVRQVKNAFETEYNRIDQSAIILNK